MALYNRLSDLTPTVVDRLYNIDGASPMAEPVFIFLVGAPGSGKSNGHRFAIEAGLLQPTNYATINIDLLLESLLPFRAASAVADFVKEKETVRFSTIGAYTSRKENLGLFKWYDAALEPAVHAFDSIRDKFLPIKDLDAPHTLVELNEAALHRAIDRRIPIIYETTLYLSKEGRVSKVDALMRYLASTPYRIVFYHIYSEPSEIVLRLEDRRAATARAEYPFVRTVPSSIESVADMVHQNKLAFDALHKTYRRRAIFQEAENPFILSASPRRSRSRSRSRRLLRAYSNPSSNLYVSPPSSEERQRRTTRHAAQTPR